MPDIIAKRGAERSKMTNMFMGTSLLCFTLISVPTACCAVVYTQNHPPHPVHVVCPSLILVISHVLTNWLLSDCLNPNDICRHR